MPRADLTEWHTGTGLIPGESRFPCRTLVACLLPTFEQHTPHFPLQAAPAMQDFALLAAIIFPVFMHTPVHAGGIVCRLGGGGGGVESGSRGDTWSGISSDAGVREGGLCWIVPVAVCCGLGLVCGLGLAVKLLLRRRRRGDVEKAALFDGKRGLEQELAKVLRTEDLSPVVWPTRPGAQGSTTMEWCSSYLEDGALKFHRTELKLVADTADPTKGYVRGTAYEATGIHLFSGRYNLRAGTLVWSECIDLPCRPKPAPVRGITN